MWIVNANLNANLDVSKFQELLQIFWETNRLSHGNLNNLHLLSNSSPAEMWLSTRNRIFSSTSIPLWWSKFFRSPISITWSRGKMRWYTYIQKISNEPGFWGTQPRLVTKMTEISLLQKLMASHNYVTNAFLLVSFSVRSKQLHCVLCTVKAKKRSKTYNKELWRVS